MGGVCSFCLLEQYEIQETEIGVSDNGNSHSSIDISTYFGVEGFSHLLLSKKGGKFLRQKFFGFSCRGGDPHVSVEGYRERRKVPMLLQAYLKIFLLFLAFLSR
jgi:hypothetical protein